MACHDSLTGLFNRACLQERLEEELAEARVHGAPGALLFLDLDDFKDINDTLGRQTGDVIPPLAAPPEP